MVDVPPIHRVEVTFVGRPPARELERASGVSEVSVDDRRLSCLVSGSFQPFLEALRGHEVLTLESTPLAPRGRAPPPGAEGAAPACSARREGRDSAPWP